MNAFDVMHESPWLTFFLLFSLINLVALPFKLANRWIRHLNIKAHGWPPVHCDADGDAVEDDMVIDGHEETNEAG